MEHANYSEEHQKALEAALVDVGNKLANPPSSTVELLRLLTRAEHILSHVHSICTCHNVVISVQDAIRPAMQALISDKIFRHISLDIQVAVASCINEIVRITISDYLYTDAQMKEIFGLFMVALKQLSCESGKNYERALQILRNMADRQACLVMLDLEVEMNTMVVEMFHLFLDTIRPHHSSDIFNHMKTIMILIVQESYDFDRTAMFNLYWPLLSSVKIENKNTSPRSWELGKAVIESCATILQQHVREIVKAKNLNVSDYAEIVASLCQDAPIGNDTVANEEVANVQVPNEEVANVQVQNEEVVCDQMGSREVRAVNEEAKTVQFVATDASGDGVSNLDERSQAVQETQIQAERRRREIKPNTLMRPEEGYQHARLGGGSGSSPEESYSVKKASIGKRDKSKNKESTMNQGNAQEVPDKQKKTSLVNHSASDSELKDKNGITAREHESKDVVEKEVGSSMSKPKKPNRSRIEKRGSDKRTKTTNGVVRCRTVATENANVSKCNENRIISKNHEPGGVLDKVVESHMSKLAKGKPSKVEESGSYKQQKTTKTGVVSSSKVCTEKEKVCNSVTDSIVKDKNENITSQKHESAVVEKAVETPTSKAAKKKKVSKKQEKTTKDVVRLQPITIGSERENVSLSGADSIAEDKNEIIPQKNEPADVVEKMLESSMSKPTKKSKANKKGLKKGKMFHSDALDARKEKVSHSDADHQIEDEKGITSLKHDKYEAGYFLDKVVESPMSPEHLNSEMEKEPIDFGLEFGRELVNLRIMVWWPIDQTYYTGTVDCYDPVTKKHKIKYDDDEEEFLNMSREKWELFNERHSPQAQSSGKRQGGPSPAKELGERTHRKAKQNKACSSKKDHGDPSSKRSKGKGSEPGHSALDPINVNDELDDDDEPKESNISWKARAMCRAGMLRQNTSRTK